MEKCNSKTSYKKGDIIYDEKTKEVFKVISCTPMFLMTGDSNKFALELEKLEGVGNE